MSKGKKRVKCTHPKCDKHGYLSVSERLCLEDEGVSWMCPKHDDQRIGDVSQRVVERT